MVMQYRLYTSTEINNALDNAYRSLEMFLTLMQSNGKVTKESLEPVREMFTKYNESIKGELKL